MTTPTARFEHLLSSRARIGWGAPGAAARPVASPRYEFGGGYPDPASFPYNDMVEATARMMKAEGAQALTYGDPQGYRGLRELVCHKYRVFEGLEVTPENIFVANGSGHALSLAFGAFVDPGDPIICEAPTFSGSLNNIRRHGPEILDVPVDADGLVTSVVRERLEGLRRQGRRCKLIYTIVNFQNPAGPDLSLRRRTELVRLAEEFDTFILEDDAYGELRFEGEPKPPVYALDRGGRVIRAGTLSKILGAGVRLGWLCAPRAMLPAFQGFNFGGGVSPFMSRVATWYLRDHMEAHVKLLIGVYRAKRDAMLRGLWEVLEGIDVEISRPQGGFFIWIRLPAATDPARLEALAVAAQAQYTSGPAFFPDGGGERFIRLAFSYEPPEKCYEGARLIARAILDARR
ncbi:MAG: aminotransferase [Candidatus Rokuibacteriota bacterium]|nr:MAG: aminotransferase [Candidatus Rokubacteria bacterium]